MELLSIEGINEKYFAYSSARGVKKWLRKQKIPVIKLGRGYFVSRIDFENEVNKMLGENSISEINTASARENKTMARHESKTYTRLLSKMSDV